LCVALDSVYQSVQLTKPAPTIKIVNSCTGWENCISFEKILIQENKAEVLMKYGIEGLWCELEFELIDGTWRIVESRVVET